jgi:hypothetical protein
MFAGMLAIGIDRQSYPGVILTKVGTQYAVPWRYGAMADIRTLAEYWIIRLRG